MNSATFYIRSMSNSKLHCVCSSSVGFRRKRKKQEMLEREPLKIDNVKTSTCLYIREKRKEKSLGERNDGNEKRELRTKTKRVSCRFSIHVSFFDVLFFFILCFIVFLLFSFPSSSFQTVPIPRRSQRVYTFFSIFNRVWQQRAIVKEALGCCYVDDARVEQRGQTDGGKRSPEEVESQLGSSTGKNERRKEENDEVYVCIYMYMCAREKKISCSRYGIKKTVSLRGVI